MFFEFTLDDSGQKKVVNINQITSFEKDTHSTKVSYQAGSSKETIYVKESYQLIITKLQLAGKLTVF
jgi:hypothetical protein